MKKFSIVIPVYNNEENIEDTVRFIVNHLDLFSNYLVEVVMVCDGSKDRSYDLMKTSQERYPDLLRIACFTRNFGQGAAVRCGMEMATGDVVGVISCDLQDPLELFVQMLEQWEAGYQLVIAARADREDKWASAFFSSVFHRLVKCLVNADYPEGGFDMYLLDRVAAKQFCGIDAPNGSTQMLLLWMGYPCCQIPYKRRRRKKGTSGWSFVKKADAAIGLFVTYSVKPIRWMEFLGVLFGCIGFLGLLACSVYGLIKGASLFGILIFSIYFACGILLSAAGIVGEYAWRDFELTKRRPRYIIKEIQQKQGEIEDGFRDLRGRGDSAGAVRDDTVDGNRMESDRIYG